MCQFVPPKIEALKRKKKVKKLIKALRHELFTMRWAAAQALKEIGDKRAVEPLIAVLLEPYQLSSVREAVSQVLGEIKDPRAVEPLIAVLLEPDQATSVREAVSQALCEIKDPRAVDPLVTFLPKSWAVKALGKLGDRRAIKPLEQTLENESFGAGIQSVAEALDALEWAPPQDALGAKYYLMRHYWPDMSEWDACTRIGEPAVEPIIRFLRFRMFFHRKDHYGPERFAKSAVQGIRCLARIGSPSSTKFLVSLLQKPPFPLDKTSNKYDALEANDQIQKVSVEALGEIGKPVLDTPGATETLITILQSGKLIDRVMSAQALEQMGWKPEDRKIELAFWAAQNRWDKLQSAGAAGIPILIEWLEFEKREEVIETLVSMGSLAVEPLLSVLEHESRGIYAADALARMGVDKGIDTLVTIALRGSLDAIWILGEKEDPRAIKTLGELRHYSPSWQPPDFEDDPWGADSYEQEKKQVREAASKALDNIKKN